MAKLLRKLRPSTIVMPIAIAIATASSMLWSPGLIATRASAGTNASSTNTTNCGNCDARIGTQATQ